MLYKLCKDTYVRKFEDIGYITSIGLFNDRVVNSTGAVFLQALERRTLTLDELLDKIMPQFTNADRDVVREDAATFYGMLAEDGFIVCGQSESEILQTEKGFTYDVIEPVTAKSNFTSKNIRTNEDSQIMLDGYFKEHPHLLNFQIELTSRCNERCVHCYIPHELKINDIEPELYYSVLDQLEELGTLHLTLSGGEPMLHPCFIDFLKAAKQKDMYVSVLSNLTLLNDDILAAMKDTNCTSVQVSLYSMVPEHHDAVTAVPGSFEKTKSAILKLIENDIPVQISCPTMKGNKDDFLAVLNWAHEHKIRAITDYSIMAEYDHSTDNLSHRLTPNECGDVIRAIIEADVDYQARILDSKFVREANKYSETFSRDEPLCGVGINTCCMVANGNVYPCPGWQLFVLGNLKEESLKEIWENSEKINYLRRLKKKDLEKCASCENAAFCSPCMVRNFNESPTGNPMEVPQYFCDVAQVNKDLVLNWRTEKMKELDALETKILRELRCRNFKAGYGWSEQQILIFCSKLPKYEQKIWNFAVKKLIEEELLELKPDVKAGVLFLTDKGEKLIYS